MGLFSVDYDNVPGRCIIAQGGLKFHCDETALREYFVTILPYISLNDLIGEAVFWFLLPSTLAIWVFPFLLYTCGALNGMVVTAVLYLIAYLVHMFVYLKPINYLVFIFGNRLLALLAYIILVVISVVSGSIDKAVMLGIYFLFFYLALDEILFLPLIRVFVMPFSQSHVSDQLLEVIGDH